MIRKMMIRAAFLGGVALAAGACFGLEDSGSKYEANIAVHYEPDYSYQQEEFLRTFFRDGMDTVSVNKYLSLGPLTHHTEMDEAGGKLIGGFAMCIGRDQDAGSERKPSRLAVYDKGGYMGSLAYVVFHDTLATLMPEHVLTFTVPNETSSCSPLYVYVQNVQAVVQAVKHGNGLSGGPFGAEDYLTLTITGSLNGKVLEAKTVKLVDGTRILEEWTKVDLSGMGMVDVLDLHLESSRADLPLYCCLDDLVFHYAEIYL